MAVARTVFGLLIGAAFGAASAIALSPAFAAFTSSEGENRATTIAMLGSVAAVALLCALAPTIRRAFGRGFLVLGASTLALPISAMLLSGRAASETIANADPSAQGTAAIGAGLAGVMFTGAATIIGLIFGAIFLIAGAILALGGQREVVIASHRRR